jgi:hypothetical protein
MDEGSASWNFPMARPACPLAPHPDSGVHGGDDTLATVLMIPPLSSLSLPLTGGMTEEAHAEPPPPWVGAHWSLLGSGWKPHLPCSALDHAGGTTARQLVSLPCALAGDRRRRRWGTAILLYSLPCGWDKGYFIWLLSSWNLRYIAIIMLWQQNRS